jgi:hypothetical protein
VRRSAPRGNVDVSFPGDDCDPNEQQDFSSWRVNVTSRGRPLLMLFLFSDVGMDDAPPRIRIGSHMDMARFLARAGEGGRSHMILERMGAICPKRWRQETPAPSVPPFLVHAAQRHRGSSPRFMAQPPLDPAEPYRHHCEDGVYSPVEIAIRLCVRQGRLARSARLHSIEQRFTSLAQIPQRGSTAQKSLSYSRRTALSIIASASWSQLFAPQ